MDSLPPTTSAPPISWWSTPVRSSKTRGASRSTPSWPSPTPSAPEPRSWSRAASPSATATSWRAALPEVDAVVGFDGAGTIGVAGLRSAEVNVPRPHERHRAHGRTRSARVAARGRRRHRGRTSRSPKAATARARSARSRRSAASSARVRPSRSCDEARDLVTVAPPSSCSSRRTSRGTAATPKVPARSRRCSVASTPSSRHEGLAARPAALSLSVGGEGPTRLDDARARRPSSRTSTCRCSTRRAAPAEAHGAMGERRSVPRRDRRAFASRSPTPRSGRRSSSASPARPKSDHEHLLGSSTTPSSTGPASSRISEEDGTPAATLDGRVDPGLVPSASGSARRCRPTITQAARDALVLAEAPLEVLVDTVVDGRRSAARIVRRPRSTAWCTSKTTPTPTVAAPGDLVLARATGALGPDLYARAVHAAARPTMTNAPLRSLRSSARTRSGRRPTSSRSCGCCSRSRC